MLSEIAKGFCIYSYTLTEKETLDFYINEKVFSLSSQRVSCAYLSWVNEHYF